jgi:hypothetical protein
MKNMMQIYHILKVIFLFALVFIVENGKTSAQSPGGVSTNLNLWLKADAGTNTVTNGATVTNWLDQSGRSKNASNVGTPVYDNAQLINFNPVISFNGTNAAFNLPLSTFPTGDQNFSFFGIVQPALNTPIQVFTFCGVNSPNKWHRIHFEPDGSINDRFNGSFGQNNSTAGTLQTNVPGFFSSHYNTTSDEKIIYKMEYKPRNLHV